jgi:hypothetical protein
MNNQVKITVKLKHDKGTIKINTLASSLEDAINKVTTSENAPLSSVIYAKVYPLTIYDIKRLSYEDAPYFFNNRTLKSFNQRVSSFKVTRLGNDKFYISAPSYGNHISERIFDPFTNKLIHL